MDMWTFHIHGVICTHHHVAALLMCGLTQKLTGVGVLTGTFWTHTHLHLTPSHCSFVVLPIKDPPTAQTVFSLSVR